MTRPAPLQPLRFPLTGSRLIEASAGTGKTYTIAALYVRLVLGHGDDCAYPEALLPPQILVVTFTEAATRELRDRIRSRLTEAARYFRSDLSQVDPLLRELRDAYPEEEAWDGCARRLEIAAQWMDEAAVSTIHGWCNRMLREHAFDSGSPFTQLLETDQRELLADAARDYWRSFVYPLQGTALDLVLTRWSTPDALQQSISSLLESARAPEPEADAAGLIREAQAQQAAMLSELKAPWGLWLDELADLLEQAAQDKAVEKQKLSKKNLENWLGLLRDWRDDPELVEPRLTQTAWERLTPDGLAAIWNAGFTAPDHPALHAIAGLKARLRQLPDPMVRVQRHAAGWVRQRFEQEQRRRAQLGFNDLLTRLDQALSGDNGERLAAVIREQFPVAMIDEFQDTDPVQYRIFDRIYRVADNPAQQGLFMIGDPKQAIYAFRGADIHTYLAARRATTGRHYTLDRNFRSSPGMVEAVNRVFEAAETRPEGRGAFGFRQPGGNPVPFVPVRANGLGEALLVDGGDQPPLTCWQVQGDDPLAKGAYLEHMAASCASEITRLLNLGQRGRAGFAPAADTVAVPGSPDAPGSPGSPEVAFAVDPGTMPLRPLQPADMAVLVRDGKEAAAIRRQLAQRRVRSVYLSDKESVFDSNEARDLLLWLKACAQPDVDRSLRAALASRTLGLDWAALERLNLDELHWEQRVLQFRDYHGLWQQQGVLPMLRRLMRDFGVQARLVARGDGERAVTNLLHLTELLQQAASELDGEQALIRHLAEHLDTAGEAVDEQVVRLESDEALVKIVTIHKAKGMEYPLVFLPFICNFKEVDGSRPPVRYHDDQGRLVLEPHPEPEHVARADQERLDEDLRLAYVALTRARHACWLGFASVKHGNGKHSQLHKSAMGYLLAAGQPMAGSELTGRLEALRGDCAHVHVLACPPARPGVFQGDAQEQEPGHAREPLRAAREYWCIASYSALTMDGSWTPETPAEANLGESHDAPAAGVRMKPLREGDTSLHRFPRGANPGTFLHGLLEWAAREGFGRVAANPARLEDEVARRCNRRGWDRWIPPVSAWLLHYLQTPLDLGTGEPVALAGLVTYQAELEFWFETHQADALALDRQVCAGTLDGRARPAVASRTLNGMLKGFIDLVFEHRGRYYIADYKSNWLGEDTAAYTPAALRDAVLEHRYDLQYVLYTLALHRLLQARLPDYDYDAHMGGAAYLFLRGNLSDCRGLHLDRPERGLIETLDSMISHQDSHKNSQKGSLAGEGA